jgi:hypothetical protein
VDGVEADDDESPAGSVWVDEDDRSVDEEDDMRENTASVGSPANSVFSMGGSGHSKSARGKSFCFGMVAPSMGKCGLSCLRPWKGANVSRQSDQPCRSSKG